MWYFGRRATKVLQQPGAFALAVLKGFRANQGVLLAGAVAYYTLLSLVPLLILVLMALSHLFAEDQLLLTLREYLEFVVPGQSDALVEELRTFLAHREVVGGVLLVTMLFFSALAFTVLENAMSVIFFHRVAIRRRHFPRVRHHALPLRPVSGLWLADCHRLSPACCSSSEPAASPSLAKPTLWISSLLCSSMVSA